MSTSFVCRLSLLFIILLFACCPKEKGHHSDSVLVSHQQRTIETLQKIDSMGLYNRLHYVQVLKDIDSILNQSSSDTLYTFEQGSTKIYKGSIFTKGNIYALARYSENDTTAVFKILKENQGIWDTILIDRFSFEDSRGEHIGDLFDLQDFNGDNIPDIKVLSSFWHIHTGENSFLWLYDNEKFVKVSGFDSIASANYDPATKRIVSYQSAGCADMNMVFEEYKILNNKAVRLRQIYCDCCSDDCIIQINEEKEKKVARNKAHLYVPSFYAEAVQEKLAPD